MFEFQRLKLAQGSHPVAGSEMCIMECVAFIAGERHSDSPKCACPVITKAAICVNDWMTQEERDEHLAPLLWSIAGTRGTEQHEKQRQYIAVNFAMKFAAMAFRSAKLPQWAEKLEAVPAVVDDDTMKAAANAAANAAAYAAYAAYAANAANAAAYAANAAAYAANAAYAAANAANAAYAANAAAYAANAAANAANAANRKKVCRLLVQMLTDMIEVHSSAPKEWARDPKTLPCLVG